VVEVGAKEADAGHGTLEVVVILLGWNRDVSVLPDNALLLILNCDEGEMSDDEDCDEPVDRDWWRGSDVEVGCIETTLAPPPLPLLPGCVDCGLARFAMIDARSIALASVIADDCCCCDCCCEDLFVVVFVNDSLNWRTMEQSLSS
jgi:hypothetical protein